MLEQSAMNKASWSQTVVVYCQLLDLATRSKRPAMQHTRYAAHWAMLRMSEGLPTVAMQEALPNVFVYMLDLFHAFPMPCEDSIL